MAKKPDVVIEAVRYAADGRINLVRGFERRGATYSDSVLIGRADLSERLKKGRRVVAGDRIEYLGSKFNVIGPVFLTGSDVIATSKEAKADLLEGVPFF
jgi:hypothetical protein